MDIPKPRVVAFESLILASANVGDGLIRSGCLRTIARHSRSELYLGTVPLSLRNSGGDEQRCRHGTVRESRTTAYPCRTLHMGRAKFVAAFKFVRASAYILGVQL